jgi:Spy/CpxP family protein refolding chaperone
MTKKQKLIYAALALSLALNVFFIGAAGNFAAKWHGFKNDTGWVEKRLTRTEQRMIRHLDGPDKALARRVFKERRPALLAALEELQNARKEFRTALSAENPDPNELRAALDRSQAAAQGLNENLHGALRDMGTGLSPEARKKIADHMRRRRQSD